jgi:hypothetical protein
MHVTNEISLCFNGISISVRPTYVYAARWASFRTCGSSQKQQQKLFLHHHHHHHHRPISPSFPTFVPSFLLYSSTVYLSLSTPLYYHHCYIKWLILILLYTAVSLASPCAYDWSPNLFGFSLWCLLFTTVDAKTFGSHMVAKRLNVNHRPYLVSVDSTH